MCACMSQMRRQLKKLKLNNAAVWDREHARENTPGWVAHEAPWPIRGAYLAICAIMDVIYDKRPIQRFWFLEVVARMPYFAYISMLHLYESLGWWRAGAELRKVNPAVSLACLGLGLLFVACRSLLSGRYLPRLQQIAFTALHRRPFAVSIALRSACGTNLLAQTGSQDYFTWQACELSCVRLLCSHAFQACISPPSC